MIQRRIFAFDFNNKSTHLMTPRRGGKVHRGEPLATSAYSAVTWPSLLR